MKLKYLKAFNEARVEFFGPSIADEKRAGDAVFMKGSNNVGTFQNAKSFKRVLVNYVFTSVVKKEFKNKLVIIPGNSSRVTVKMKDMLSKSEIEKILKDNLKSFRQIYGKDLKIKDVNDDSFVLEY